MQFSFRKPIERLILCWLIFSNEKRCAEIKLNHGELSVSTQIHTFRSSLFVFLRCRISISSKWRLFFTFLKESCNLSTRRRLALHLSQLVGVPKQLALGVESNDGKVSSLSTNSSISGFVSSARDWSVDGGISTVLLSLALDSVETDFIAFLRIWSESNGKHKGRKKIIGLIQSRLTAKTCYRDRQ